MRRPLAFLAIPLFASLLVFATPAHSQEVITVGSYDVNGVFSPFSNWGPKVDLLAPGEAVISLSPNGDPVSLAGPALSLDNTLIDVVVPSSTVAVSLFAVGGSLTLATLTVTTNSADKAGAPVSVMVTVKVSVPKKSLAGE